MKNMASLIVGLILPFIVGRQERRVKLERGNDAK